MIILLGETNRFVNLDKNAPFTSNVKGLNLTESPWWDVRVFEFQSSWVLKKNWFDGDESCFFFLLKSIKSMNAKQEEDLSYNQSRLS